MFRAVFQGPRPLDPFHPDIHPGPRDRDHHHAMSARGEARFRYGLSGRMPQQNFFERHGFMRPRMRARRDSMERVLALPLDC